MRLLTAMHGCTGREGGSRLSRLAHREAGDPASPTASLRSHLRSVTSVSRMRILEPMPMDKFVSSWMFAPRGCAPKQMSVSPRVFAMSGCSFSETTQKVQHGEPCLSPESASQVLLALVYVFRPLVTVRWPGYICIGNHPRESTGRVLW